MIFELRGREIMIYLLTNLQKNWSMLKISHFVRSSQALRVNKSIVPRIKNAIFSGCCFYMNKNIKGDFQICISIPFTAHLINFAIKDFFTYCACAVFNPIEDGRPKRPPYQFFPCNLYKRRNWPLKLSDF